MKRLILSILALSMIIGFSGCAKRIIKPDIREIPHVKSKNDMTRYQIYGSNNYQLLGVFNDTIDNRSNINNILLIMKEKINNKKKTFRNTPKPYTHNEELEICKKRVFIGKYGRYRNSIEKDDLLRYCMDKTLYERKNYYTGITSIAKIKNNILTINSKIGDGKSIDKTWQTIKTININNKIYLIVCLSKNSLIDELLFINTNLLDIINHNKNIIAIQPPFEVDFNKFSKLL